MSAVPPTFDDAVARLTRALAGRRAPRVLEVDGFRRAAVLVPILNRPEGPTLLFTRRTETVTTHKGQVSFPGGRVEAGEDAVATALREAREEVALDPASVEILATFDDLPSISSYMVTPVLAAVRNPPPAFVIQASEVVEPFEVPLATLLDRARFRTESWSSSRLPPGTPVEALMKLRLEFEEIDPVTGEYQVYFFDGGDGRVIWGLTGRILKDVLDLSYGFSEWLRSSP